MLISIVTRCAESFRVSKVDFIKMCSHLCDTSCVANVFKLRALWNGLQLTV